MMADNDNLGSVIGTRRFLAINPNTNDKVTGSIRQVLEALASPGTVIDVVSPEQGPYAVESERDKAQATSSVLELIRKRMAEGYAGYILACFDDIAVAEARTMTRAPVISLAEAGIRYAHATGGPFTVITTFDEAVPTIEALCQRYGMSERCTVKATGIGVTETAAKTVQAEALLHALVTQAKAQGATAIVLGSGAFAGRGQALKARHGLEVMDGFSQALDYVTQHAIADCCQGG